MSTRFQPSGSKKSTLTSVFLPILSDLAAAGPHTLQPGLVDPHSGRSASQAVLLPGDRLPGRRTHLRQCEESQHGSPDCAHIEVLLLGCEPTVEERHHS